MIGMIPSPSFEVANNQLIVRWGNAEAHSVGVYPPSNAAQAMTMLRRVFLLGARAQRQKIIEKLDGSLAGADGEAR